MDIFDLDQSLIQRYESFARSFSEIRAPEIRAQVDAAYNEQRFWPEPLITINPRYEEADHSIGQLIAQDVLDPATSKIFATGPDRTPITLYRHQERAVAKARNGESFIVTTGTGSGKSLCFFLPIVDAVVRARRAGQAQRTRAIVIYPMNALANSQLEELEKFIGGSGVEEELRPTFGRYTGQESDVERQAIAKAKPDILLTNFMMLELLMTRQDELDRAVIANASGLDFLVLDELHTYRGRQGADVAMLVRRVKDRLVKESKLLCIGTSATMSSAQDEVERASAVARVGKLIFGEEMSSASVIDENLARATDPRINSTSLGASLVDAVRAPVRTELRDKELSSNPLACWIETEIGLEEGEKLRRRPPMTLSDATKKLAAQTKIPSEECRIALAGMLSMMGRREDLRGGVSDRAFLAFKLHRFISGAGHAYATIEPSTGRRVVLEGQIFHPSDPNARLYPIFFCRECGQEHHSVRVENALDGIRILARAIDEPASEDSEPDGSRTGFLVPAVNGDFQFSGAVADYPDDWQETTPAGQERLKAGHRGKHEGQLLYLKPDGSLGDDGIPAWFFAGKYRFCPHCRHQPPQQARDINKLAGLSAEGRSSATTLIVSTILAWMEADGTLEENTRKLLGFTDNRQDAALQAGHFNDFVFVSLLRGGILRAVRDAGEKGLADVRFGEACRLRWDQRQADHDAQVKRVEDLRQEQTELLPKIALAKQHFDRSADLVTSIEKARDAREATWYSARRLQDDVERLAELFETQEAGIKRLRQLSTKLETERERLGTFRDRQSRVFGRMSEKFDPIIRRLVGHDAKGRIVLTGNGLDLSVGMGGDRRTVAIDSLKVLAFDLAAMCVSIEGAARVPAFLLHDSPREADLGLSIYGRLFDLLQELERGLGTPLFQYIVTTTTAPPVEFRDLPYLRLKLHGNPPEQRFLGVDL